MRHVSYESQRIQRTSLLNREPLSTRFLVVDRAGRADLTRRRKLPGGNVRYALPEKASEGTRKENPRISGTAAAAAQQAAGAAYRNRRRGAEARRQSGAYAS